MPSASISAYMRNVVSGERNSCVTADTNAARRSLNANTLRSMTALATPPSTRQHQAISSEMRMADKLAGDFCSVRRRAGQVRRRQ